ncbi:hypothetical protein D6D01_06807 [Aureobasidium pullulans]|uniref:MARVEL domain-containing protein n=1 Tax=Aureobasidium pullulans TaxID=5580 RepID=A0A4S9KW41_AURPU|nr:hypothetical protein D6D01_06807 [Aureobasidium pullulans]
MGLFNRKKVDSQPGIDVQTNGATTAPPSSTSRTGISRFGRGGTRSSHSQTPGELTSKAIRTIQFLLAVLILGLVSYALHVYSTTFLQAAYIPAIIAAILTMLVTIPLAFLSRISGLATHPLHAGLVDLFFTLFWLAVMAELAAYSDVASPKDVTYYSGGFDNLPTGGAYAAYSDAIGRLRRAWACGAAAAAFAGVEFNVLFLVIALLPLRGRLAGPITGSDSVGVPTSHHGSGRHSGSEPAFEMQMNSVNAGHSGRTSPIISATVHGARNTEGQVPGGTNMLGSSNRNTFVPTPPGQHEGGYSSGERANMI